MWVVRDRQGFLVFFAYEKPVRDNENGIWVSPNSEHIDACCELPSSLFSALTWKDEPVEVKFEKVIHEMSRKLSNDDEKELEEKRFNRFWGIDGGYPARYMRDNWYGD